MKSKKIAIVTGSRADYSHLSGIIKKVKEDPSLELQLIATGSHLSPSHGYTIKEIESDGIPVHTQIDMKLTGDTPVDLCASISILMKEISVYFKNENPDCVVVLGDRYELLPVANAAVLHQIPIVHIHGGEATEGLIDDAVRHSVTKMAKIHLVATDVYKKRVIQMGEEPNSVYNFGAPGLDNIKNLTLKTRSELEKDLKIQFKNQNILLTYHPITLSKEKTTSEIKALLEELSKLDLEKTSIFITLPNADTYNSIVFDQLSSFLKKHPSVLGFSNLGYINYLSLMKQVNVVVGNSSSGLIEAPFLGRAVLNVGIRQKGRMTSEHVINTDDTNESIAQALKKALDPNFQAQVLKVPSAYGDGNACEKIIELFKTTDFAELRYKKFYDIDFRFS